MYVHCVLTFVMGNEIPTAKLHSQLRKPAIDMAGGRGPCLNISAPMNCGTDPMGKNGQII